LNSHSTPFWENKLREMLDASQDLDGRSLKVSQQCCRLRIFRARGRKSFSFQYGIDVVRSGYREDNVLCSSSGSTDEKSMIRAPFNSGHDAEHVAGVCLYAHRRQSIGYFLPSLPCSPLCFDLINIGNEFATKRLGHCHLLSANCEILSYCIDIAQ